MGGESWDAGGQRKLDLAIFALGGRTAALPRPNRGSVISLSVIVMLIMNYHH